MAAIGIDYTPAYEQGGGIGRLTRELIGALARQPTNHDYRLFVSGATQRQLPPRLTSQMRWCPTRLSPRSLARLWHRARVPIPVEVFTGQIDLFHATDFTLPPTLPRTRTLLTVHDLSFIRVPESASPALKAYLDDVVPRSVKRAHHVIADSEATKVDLIELYRVRADRISVILSGVNSQFKRVTDTLALAQVRARYQIGDEPFIFAIGTVQPRKNYVRLVQALAKVRRHHSVKLVIAGGRGWLEDGIYKAIDGLGLNEHVHFIGFAADEDLPTLYSAAACMAFPSLYEGFGLPILEAMACGTPVLTSAISSLPEAAGNAALLIDPYDVDDIADTLDRILSDRQLRESLVERGHARASQFTWDSAARKLAGLYEKLLNQ